eukprot:4239703-Ditylum_brightwellii.AAC.1
MQAVKEKKKRHFNIKNTSKQQNKKNRKNRASTEMFTSYAEHLSVPKRFLMNVFYQRHKIVYKPPETHTSATQQQQNNSKQLREVTQNDDSECADSI